MEKVIIERFDFEQPTLKSGESKCESSIKTLTFYISIMDFETEAINSTVTWYQNAVKCYVFLADVSTPTSEDDRDSQLRNSR
jgi:hypothetical protein